MLLDIGEYFSISAGITIAKYAATLVKGMVKIVGGGTIQSKTMLPKCKKHMNRNSS